MSTASPGCHLCFWPTDSKSEVPMTPFLGLITLIEWITEPREIFYLLYYWIIIKGYNSGTARWKRNIGKRMGKGCRIPMPFSLNLHVFTNTEALWTQSLRVSKEASLHRHDWKSLAIGDWFNLQSLSPPPKSGGGTKSSKSLLLISSPGNQSLSLVLLLFFSLKSPH